MLREEAANLLEDARRAGHLPVRVAKEDERDKRSWVVYAAGRRLAAPADLARLVGAGTGRAQPMKAGLRKQAGFLDLYEGRFGHYTHIERD